MSESFADEGLTKSIEYYGLKPSSDPMVWRLELGPTNVTPGGSLQGGVGLGAALMALEAVTGRRTVWSAAQYIAYASPPHHVEVELVVEVAGYNVTQARATLTQEGREVLTAHVALGHRDFEVSGQIVEKPITVSPEESDSNAIGMAEGRHMFDMIDFRVAKGKVRNDVGPEPGDGNCIFYARVPNGPKVVSVCDIAVMADLLPMAFGDAMGAQINGNSIDNTIRFGDRAFTEWVLIDCHIFDVRHGFGHGIAHLWADDGTYLGTASQSTILRNIGADGRLIRTTPKRNAAGD